MIQNGNWGWAMIYDLDGNVVKEEDIKFLPIYTGVEEKKTRDFVSEQKTISVSTIRFLKLTRKHLKSS